MNEPDQSFEQDTEDTLVRDACSVGYYGPKSVYRRRLRAYTQAQVERARIENIKHITNQVEKLRSHDEHPMGGYPVLYRVDLTELLHKMLQNAESKLKDTK